MQLEGDVSMPSVEHWTGNAIWESAQVLAKLLSAEPARIRGKRVLELGTGCGLLGLAAGALGAREVTLTDDVLFMADYNLRANFADQPELRQRFHLQQLRWGDAEQIAAAAPPYEVVLGSDLLYNSGYHEALAQTIAALSVPGTTVLFASPDGAPGDESSFSCGFYQMLEAEGFEVRDISRERVVAKALGPWGVWGMYGRGPVRVVEMRMGKDRSRL